MAGAFALGCAEPELPIEQPIPMPGPSPFVYPVALWDMRVNGETLLLVHVLVSGQVDSVTVFNGSGYIEFDSAAIAGARKLQFVPGKKGDRPVSMWTKLPVKFSIDSASAELGNEPSRSPIRQ